MKEKVKVYYQKLRRWVQGLSKLQFVTLLLAITLLFLGSAGALYLHRLSDLDRIFGDISWGQPDPTGETGLDSVFTERKIINIALLGHDSDEERSQRRLKGYTGLVDTIMVAAINIETGEVNIVSIPRDSYVPIYNQGGFKDKINSANYWGWKKGLAGAADKVEAGLLTQIETVSQVLGGVPIHFYLALDMEAVVEIVDTMGGVWYDVPERTYHNRGRIIAEPGYQWFGGKRFLAYIRSRVAGGDYQRAKKQQNVMVALFQQFKQANQLLNLPKILSTLKHNLRTNLSNEQIAALGLFGAREIEAAKIHTHTLEGALTWGAIPGRAEGNNYYLINHRQQADLVESIWGIAMQPAPPDTLLPVKKPPLNEGSSPEDEPWQDLNDIPSQP